MKILALIPARGGSKGIPNKNIQKIGGKHLIEYTINSAKCSKLIDKIIVSTDSKKIASISKSAGAEVPFIRPKNFSRNDSPTIEVIKHALEFLDKNQFYVPDIILLLQPTSPFRSNELLDKSIKKLKRSKVDIVLGVKKIKTHPYRSFWIKRGYLKPFKQEFLKYHQRQLFPDCYYPTGSLYTFWNKTIQKYGNIYGLKIKPILIDNKELNIDIDNIFDLFVSEMTIKYWQKYKKKFIVKEKLFIKDFRKLESNKK